MAIYDLDSWIGSGELGGYGIVWVCIFGWPLLRAGFYWWAHACWCLHRMMRRDMKWRNDVHMAVRDLILEVLFVIYCIFLKRAYFTVLPAHSSSVEH